ncbi:hypothetical protein J4Q44_G00387800 [Coregonus suidteri]|uniref:Uncharacterized protein n=1 Tax=Coregonus suidteri TaxID=861788 RepID=A0AAN8KL65_9TELE
MLPQKLQSERGCSGPGETSGVPRIFRIGPVKSKRVLKAEQLVCSQESPFHFHQSREDSAVTCRHHTNDVD